MAGCCDAVDFCCTNGLKPCCQCVYPCIKVCGGANRKIFYNFDKTESVEPLVDYFKPTNTLARRNLVKGMSLDSEALKKGLTPVQQIAAVIYFAHKNDLKVRAVGHGCSWSNHTDTRDILVDMLNLDQILKAEPQNEDDSVYHITVQGGMIMRDFVRAIDTQYGMGLPTMGNYDRQSVAGVVSTSTHGEGHNFQTLSNFVVELHMVIAKGIQVKVRAARDGEEDEDFESIERRIHATKYGDPPVRIYSRNIFRAAAVGLGSLGVIYAVTLECIPVYNIKQTRQYIELDWSSDRQLLNTPSELKHCASGTKGYQSILINPFPRKSSQDSDKDVVSSVYILGKRSEDNGDRGCIGCMDRGCNCCCVEAYKGQILPTDCNTSTAQMLTNCYPSLVPRFVEWGLKQFLRDTYTKKWHDVLVFLNGNLSFKDAEYCVPLANLEYALADIVSIMQDYYKLYRVYSLLLIYVRTVKADDLYLSPANRRRADGKEVDQYCYIDVPFHYGAYGADEFQKKIEDHLITHYQGRPHWGKNHFLNSRRVKKLYPDLHKWKRVYRLFNSDGTFDNKFTRTVGFEDFRQDSEGSVDQLQVIHSSSVVKVSSNAHHHHHHHNHADWPHNHHSSGQGERRHQEVISTQPKPTRVLPPTLSDDREHFTPIPIYR